MSHINKKAEMGIGTLIIFIAMILVAAIAAGVLLQTASSLQNKALLTGEKSKGQVSTSLSPILLYAEDGQDQDLENFYLKAKLAPGSDPIKLDELLLTFDLQNVSADLSYRAGAPCVEGANGFNTNPTTGQGNYTVTYLVKSDAYVSGYIQRGDVIEFCFEAPRSVIEDEDISVKLVPKIGTPTVIEAATPDVITDQKVVIYP